jgi:hypothetical protein
MARAAEVCDPVEPEAQAVMMVSVRRRSSSALADGTRRDALAPVWKHIMVPSLLANRTSLVSFMTTPNVTYEHELGVAA